MNAFALYADQAIPEAARRRQEKADKPPSALDLKMAEKQRLNRAYRRWHTAHVREVLSGEPRLLAFKAYLRTVQADNASELIAAIAESWLPASPQEVRLLALRMVDARCDRINRSFGFPPLDDPLPPETNTYLRARELLHTGGRG